MSGYRIVWPIVDDTLTLTQLIDEAEPQLPDRCAELGMWQASTPDWRIREGHEVENWSHYGGLLLVAVLDVQPMTDVQRRDLRVQQLVRERFRISA